MQCAIDENGLCPGCFRTEEEVINWNIYNDTEKRERLKKTYQRFNQAHRENAQIVKR